jgi:hypothetical protein
MDLFTKSGGKSKNQGIGWNQSGDLGVPICLVFAAWDTLYNGTHQQNV